MIATNRREINRFGFLAGFPAAIAILQGSNFEQIKRIKPLDMYGNSPDITSMPTLVSNKSSKNARIEARLTAEQKSLIEQAAAYEGRSISDFVIASVQKAAKSVIESHQLIQLTATQSAKLFELLEKQEKPNRALRNAVRDYKVSVTSK